MRKSARPQISFGGGNTPMKRQGKTPEQKTPTREELIKDIKVKLCFTDYRQTWMIHRFVNSIFFDNFDGQRFQQLPFRFI